MKKLSLLFLSLPLFSIAMDAFDQSRTQSPNRLKKLTKSPQSNPIPAQKEIEDLELKQLRKMFAMSAFKNLLHLSDRWED